MNTQELATFIYNYINKLNIHSEGWDEWDDKREIKYIKNLIDHNQPKIDTGTLTKQQLEGLKYHAKELMSTEMYRDNWNPKELSNSDFNECYELGSHDADIANSRFILDFLKINYL